MKNFAKRVSALVLALVVGAAALCPAAFAAASLPDLPRDQCVVDDANVLSDSTTQTIVDLNNQLQSSCNGAQIGVLTVDYTGNYSTEDYATQAFNAWGIGSASENNGVLILLVMESPIYEDGDYYVTYGDGFRNTTLESQASALAQTMEGDFVNRDYSDAVITCANNVASTIADIYGVSLSGNNGSYAQPDDGPTTFEDVVLGIVILFMSLMVMLIIVLFVFRVFIAPIGHAAGWNCKTLSAIFTIAQTSFYYLILCTAAGTGNCNINLFIYTSVWCSNHNIISFSVYLDIPDISPGNKFFQFFYCAFSQLLFKFFK